jgi:phospholipid/cholesterol/gamma-HCH transport system substrate-binding protein
MNKRQLTRVLVAAAVVTVGAVIFLMNGGGSLFETQAVIRTYMANSAGLAPSAPVRLNGILAGSVKQTVLSGSTDPRRAVEVDMRVPRKFLAEIPVDSKAGITASNMLGDKYVDITRGIRPERVKDGDEIGSLQTDDIPEVLAQSSALLRQFQPFLDRLEGLLTDARRGEGNVGRLFTDATLQREFNTTAVEVKQVIRDAKNGQGVLGHTSDLSDELQKVSRHIDEMQADFRKMPQYGQISDEGKAAMADARADMDEAKKMLDDLKAGQGTAGKLLKDDEIDVRLTEIAKKVDLAEEKINSGEGTIGRFMTDPELSDSIAQVSKEYNAALKAYNKNPKKFRAIKVSLF